MLDYTNLSMNYAQVKIWGRKATKKNPYTLVVAFICSDQDLGTWHRSMEHRGIYTHTTLAQRDFTSEEKEHMKTYTRLRWIHYKGWESLIVDEYLVTENTEWVQTLITASNSATLTVEQVILKALLP